MKHSRRLCSLAAGLTAGVALSVSAGSPTPRWPTHDAVRLGIDTPEGAPVSTRERAHTSPIWYTP